MGEPTEQKRAMRNVVTEKSGGASTRFGRSQLVPSSTRAASKTAKVVSITTIFITQTQRGRAQRERDHSTRRGTNFYPEERKKGLLRFYSRVKCRGSIERKKGSVILGGERKLLKSLFYCWERKEGEVTLQVLISKSNAWEGRAWRTKERGG